jgi:hypothetical protein
MSDRSGYFDITTLSMQPSELLWIGPENEIPNSPKTIGACSYIFFSVCVWQKNIEFAYVILFTVVEKVELCYKSLSSILIFQISNSSQSNISLFLVVRRCSQLHSKYASILRCKPQVTLPLQSHYLETQYSILFINGNWTASRRIFQLSSYSFFKERVWVLYIFFGVRGAALRWHHVTK